MSRGKLDIVGPFKVAMNGIVFTLRTQRHMRFHIFVVIIVILLSIIANLPLRETLGLLFTISLVLVAEMFNSAIEATVDLASPNYNPLAKFAKDIAAGAVLISTIFAIVVGAMIFLGEGRWDAIKIAVSGEGFKMTMLVRLLLGAAVLFFVVLVGKGLGERGRVLQGGLVSGHAAFGFFFATSVPFLTDSVLASGLAILLAAIIAQSRFEAKFHSIFELSLGAIVGVVLSLVIFGVVPR